MSKNSTSDELIIIKTLINNYVISGSPSLPWSISASETYETNNTFRFPFC